MSAVLEPDLMFRPFLETDLDNILAIEQRAYAFPWSRKIFLDCIRVGYHCLVLENKNSPIAYSVISIAAGECHILNLCVNPTQQHQGFGKIMLEYIVDIATQEQAQTIFLEVRPSNQAALALYNGCGFSEVGSRKEYYPAVDQREDAIIMARQIITDSGSL